MNVCVVQPGYSLDYGMSDQLYEWEMDILDKCDESMDIIVFPEYSNIPAIARTKEEMEESFGKYDKPLMQKAAETAKRCNAVLFISGIHMTETGLRNAIIAYGRDGKEAGCYYKQHLVPSEMNTLKLDKDYTYEFSEPTILTIDGIRYGFLICYDFYFYEAFSNIARYNPDVIIACTHQRSDNHETTETMTKFCAYNCNAYVVRSSVSFGEDSEVGGNSMIVGPDGRVIADLYSKIGFTVAEIDPHEHFLKPAGFGNLPDVHHNYIERGRRPWKYRPGGSAIVCPDDVMPYPRICAHGGMCTIAPANSMPAFGAAVAMGAKEIAFEIWETRDGEAVAISNPDLEQLSDGTGYVWDYKYKELLGLDFGSKYSEQYTGLKITSFEDILAKFSCHTIMNIQMKSKDDNQPLEEEYLKKIVALIKKYDCEKYCYFTTGNEMVLKQLGELAPHIARCIEVSIHERCEDVVEKTLRTKSKKIQMNKAGLTEKTSGILEIFELVHKSGIICNVYDLDESEEIQKYLDMGVDTVLTKDYFRIKA